MKREALGGILFAAIILFIVMSLEAPGTKFGNAWQYLTSGNQSQQSTGGQSSYQPPATGTGGSSVVGSPSLTAQQIDSILANAGSPAQGTGAVFVADGMQYGIDPAYALAFFKHESSFGTQGAATQTHSIGNINCTAGYDCVGRFRAYSSWADGIDDWFRLIRNLYIDKWNCSTVDAIIPRYAPSSDGNNENGYIEAVKQDVQNWRS